MAGSEYFWFCLYMSLKTYKHNMFGPTIWTNGHSTWDRCFCTVKLKLSYFWPVKIWKRVLNLRFWVKLKAALLQFFGSAHWICHVISSHWCEVTNCNPDLPVSLSFSSTQVLISYSYPLRCPNWTHNTDVIPSNALDPLLCPSGCTQQCQINMASAQSTLH